MPFPTQTDRQSIIESAYVMILENGVDGLSLAKLAAAVGVKAPSLYRHVKNKEAVLELVIELTFSKLFAVYEQVFVPNISDLERCVSIALSHRQFAQANINTYMLAFSKAQPHIDEQSGLVLGQAVALQKLVATFAGEEDSLAALRGLLALAHGFVTLELSGQFQRGGDLDKTFEQVVQVYVDGWQAK